MESSDDKEGNLCGEEKGDGENEHECCVVGISARLFYIDLSQAGKRELTQLPGKTFFTFHVFSKRLWSRSFADIERILEEFFGGFSLNSEVLCKEES